MSADVERGLLVLLSEVARQREEEPIDLDQFPGPGRELVDATTVEDAVDLLRLGLSSGRERDVTAAIQGLALGVWLNLDAGSDRPPRPVAQLRALAARMLVSVGADTSGGAELLVDAVAMLAAAVTIDDARSKLVDAFGSRLTIEDSVTAANLRVFRGPAAALAAQIVDVTRLVAQAACRATTHRDPDTSRDATFVRYEACTALPYETCMKRIDPLHWPDCNPYFSYVTALDCQPCVPKPGWFGRVKEKVGPALNLSYYETDLTIRYHQEQGMAVSAFELAHPNTGDGRVTVDRGFLAVLEEGTHRRVQMTKVYRIADLKVPQRWVCPLWASQFVISGWSCSMADPMRRALHAWSTVLKGAIATTRAACDALHCDCPDHKTTARRSRVGPLDSFTYEVPDSIDCPPSDTGVEAEVRVSIPTAKAARTFAPHTANLLTPGMALTVPYPISVDSSVPGDVDSVVVKLASPTPRGLFVGRLRDAAGSVDVPFTIFQAGL